MIRLLIIGGSDAGISAALRAKEVEPSADVTVLVADNFPNYSICGLPFFLSGEVPNWHQLAHRTYEDITQKGINLLLNYRAMSIDNTTKVVTAVDRESNVHQFEYDRLVIATGAVPIRPFIEGIDLPGVYFLRTMADSFAVHQHLINRNPKSAIIVGAGYIGLEMADALTTRGLNVTVVEHSDFILKAMNPSLGQLIHEELQHHGVKIYTGVSVQTISQQGEQLVVTGSLSFQATADLVLVSVGVQPLTDIAQSAGIALGAKGAIQVNRAMETNISSIYAAGDCAETWHRLLGKSVYVPLGTK